MFDTLNESLKQKETQQQKSRDTERHLMPEAFIKPQNDKWKKW